MVDTIVRGVIARRPTAHPSEVEWLVRKELERFRDARVTQFIPVLVERAVLVRLAASPAEERQEAQVS
jgi:hypothetical protein